MTEFSRGYSPEKLASLIAHAQRGHWVAKLFKLWRPSGTLASDGLRLAFRNDTINLYRNGQSVAKVGLSGSVPWLSVHWKYALDAQLAKGPYVRMNGDHLLARDGTLSANFSELFNDWMIATAVAATILLLEETRKLAMGVFNDKPAITSAMS